MKTSLLLCSLAACAVVGTTKTLPQGLPDAQPNLISIWRESVKPGRSLEHAKHEAGFPAAYEKANSPNHYLALTSLTGADEAWYVTPFESNAAIGDMFKREEKDATLSAELDRLFRMDAEYVSAVSIIQARARPDLSLGKFPDLSKTRFFEISVYRVRPGRVDQFEASAKAYGAAAKRAAPETSYRVYQVVAGMPKPTFFVFSSVADYAGFDQMDSDEAAIVKALTAEERASIEKFLADGIVEEETNRYRIDPGQSYSSKETRAKDPDFWSPK